MSEVSLLQARFLAPRYWSRWLLFGGMALLTHLPYPKALRLGAWLGGLAARFAHRQRRTAAFNLERCFPELDAKQRAALLHSSFESLGIGAVETAFCWWAAPQRLAALVCEIEGEHHLEAALQHGRGVLLVAAHFTNMEIGGVMLARHRPMAALYRPHKDEMLEIIMSRARLRLGRLISRENMRAIVRALRDNMPLWYAPDENYRGVSMVFSPFFGVPAASNPGTSKLARVSGASVVPFWQERLPGYRGYRLRFGPPLAGFPSGDLVADTTVINELIADMVRQQPEHYMWLLRRFKTRPPGEAAPY